MTVHRSQRSLQRQPVSLYRIELGSDSKWLTDGTVSLLLDYLTEIGISHLWLAAPAESCATPETGVVPRVYRPLRELAALAHSRGLGLIIDITPACTDVALPQRNAWWWDVLLRGRHSHFACYFAIDFEADPQHRVRVPLLPPTDSEPALEHAGDRLRLQNSEQWDVPEFPLVAGTTRLPVPEAMRQQLYRILPVTKTPNYRYTRDEPNYAALRQENGRVFDETHKWLRQLIYDGCVDGVCVRDVIDLRKPDQYLGWLRATIGEDRLLYADRPNTGLRILDVVLPIDGTSGTDVGHEVTGVFSAPSDTVTYVPRSEFHLVLGEISRHWPHTLSVVHEPRDDEDRATNLATTLIHLTGPGITAIDAGSEHWDRASSLKAHVDRCRLAINRLSERNSLDPVTEEGLARFHIFLQALRLRAERPDVFVGGEYEPLTPAGEAQSNVVAFERAREHSLPEIVVVAARHIATMPHEDGRPRWGDTTIPLPTGMWRDVLTGRRHEGSAHVADVFAEFPVALFVRAGGALREPRPFTPRSEDSDTSEPEPEQP